ncbi:protein of unknown function [Butyrivibrio proteoclasticus]|uniref:DUF4316 domain-containing protein n=1 Tax=Butyrivibrio proteoclasticus TaxID=43305 RepID=A0A1I5WT63_9FIRM|nr:DUF4316 domain-containing protein [Butyrivibrio proteoclasticus]SFQ22934.1 protein of unknown function [Butyrivibrio proteoclasticus]
MSGLDIANDRLHKEEELTEKEESILEQHSIHSKKNYLKSVEDIVEGNDNNFDGMINAATNDSDGDGNTTTELSSTKAREYEEARDRAIEEENAAKERKHARAHTQSHREIDR